jgi:stage V sporulation protein AC
MYYIKKIVKNINMNNEKYDEIIKSVVKEESILKNVFIAFISGGLIGIVGQFLTDIYLNYFELKEASFLTFSTFIVIGSILTGIGVFDKVLSFCKCGLIVPSTGFANTMTSSAMDAKHEGFIKGIGSSIFKLTGSIILYGIVFGLIFGFIRSII